MEHLWATERKDEAMARLGLLCKVVGKFYHCWAQSCQNVYLQLWCLADLTSQCGQKKAEREALRVSCWLRYGDWKSALCRKTLTDDLATDILLSYKRATDVDAKHYFAWHRWALINFQLAEQICGKSAVSSLREAEGLPAENTTKSPTILRSHVIAAVKGFVRAISVGTKRWSASVQQDLLNLLSCLFKYATTTNDVASTINEGLGSIKIEAWLGVLPQLLARIHIKSPAVRSVLHPLLVRLGAKHPQALSEW